MTDYGAVKLAARGVHAEVDARTDGQNVLSATFGALGNRLSRTLNNPAVARITDDILSATVKPGDGVAIAAIRPGTNYAAQSTVGLGFGTSS